MVQILGLVLLSFFVLSVLLVPFINLLYRIKFLRQKQETRDVFETRTPIFDKLHAHKIGTPLGGGALIIAVVTILYLVFINLAPALGIERTSLFPYKQEVQVLLFTFLAFGLLGLYDDLIKTFGFRRAKFWGLRWRHKVLLQGILSIGIAIILNLGLGIDLLNIRFFDTFHLGLWYIPFAAFLIFSFANAVNISDGLDGLASGLLLVSLIVFLILSHSILDTTLSVFIGLLIGALIAFLYFNIWPARIWLGDVGALSLGATLAVIGLLLGKPLALVVIGGMFVLEASSSLVQILSKKFTGHKIFDVSPLHLWFQFKGWEEPKIVFRFWLAQMVFAIFGLWLAFF